MPDKVFYIEDLKGLSEEEIPALQQQFGKNIFQLEHSRRLYQIIWDILKEPMFILLTVACLLYFILGESSEGSIMLAAMLFVAAISIYQENRSTKALKALRQYTEPKVTVIRNGQHKVIDAIDLLPGDIMILEEGDKIPADATIVQANDLSINESIITGESFPVEKNSLEGKNDLFQGAIINSGKCIASVTAIGNQTVLGKLGKAVAVYSAPKTLLQQQIGKFVRRLFYFGLTAFVIIWVVNYFKTDSLVQSLLFALTLAMAAIPEEIPVAFSSFMALGAYHMSKLGIISRQPQTIENLGAVTVICLDKTGTITENKMEVKMIYDFETNRLLDIEKMSFHQNGNVLRYAMLASETDPFDAMEKAIHEAYQKYTGNGTASLKQVYEYPLEGRPPMMTHVYQYENTRIIAAKGAAERILNVCKIDQATEKVITDHVKYLASKGYRVLGVASATDTDGQLPSEQNAFHWRFEGLISLYDPPKKNIQNVFRQFYDASIKLKLLTGDYPETAINVAEQTGMLGYLKYHTGNEVMNMNEEELRTAVQTVNLFARMFPEAKLKVIDALKANGEIVAMTGDGVNDGPALRSSDIGIAMGKKGTEIAKQAADLILTDDNLEKVSEAIQQGRKIFSNLKKAVRYIISIHIPIILTAALPVLMGWKYPNIFTPIHVIFLEMIMGPTCSIFFEREPVEKNIMLVPPRDRKMGLFREDELLISIVQGVIIAGGILTLYYFFMKADLSIEETRNIVFTTLIASNIFLTFVNRSFTENFTRTIFYKNNLAPWVIIISISFLASIHLVPFVRDIFQVAQISFADLLLCLGVAFASVMWFELYKTNLKLVK